MISTAFLLAAVVLAITPGPGLAYVVARTVAGGRAQGLASTLGTGLGGLVHVAAAALGLSVLVAESALAFAVVKVVGAAFLIWLGLRMLMRPQATDVSEGDAAVLAPVTRRGVGRALFDGIVVECLNVKTAVFFLAFLPQFVVATEPLVPQLVLLGSVCVLLNTLVDIVAVLAADRLLQGGAIGKLRARWLTRMSGATLVGLGIWLALARRQGN